MYFQGDGAVSQSGSPDVWHDQGLLVVEQDASMPLRCACCNARIATLDEVVLSWHPKRAFRGIGVRDGFELLAETQSFRLRYGYCSAHRPILSSHLVSNIFGVLTVAFLMTALCSVTLLRPGWPFLWLLCGAVASLFIAIAASMWPWGVRVVRMSPGGRAWVSGFGDAYLNALPVLGRDD